MRKIDRWLGTSLCLTLTLWARLMRVLALGPKQSSSPRRILFMELAEIGGLVVAYPALAQAKKRFADAELFFLTFKGGQGILDLLGIIDRDHQIIIRPDGLLTFIRDTLAAIWRMRKLGIDTTINLEVYARFSTLLAYLSGAKRRAGFHRFYEEGHYLGDLLTHKVIYNPHHHAARTFITLVESVAEEVDAEPRAKIPLSDFSLTLPCLSTSDADRQVIRDKLRQAYPALEDRHRLVLLNPNASDLVAARRWPTQNFLEVARGLLQDPGILIVLTGTAEERDHCQKVKQDLESERVLNLAGQTTLPQLIDLYNQASLLITNDSGPAHFASLTRLPVLVLFGPETPRIYGPLGPQVQVIYLALSCSPCVSVYNQKRSPCQDNQCLKKITPQQVLKHAQEILTRPGHH
jgi:lipopolysaccharide heptosyltransferase II